MRLTTRHTLAIIGKFSKEYEVEVEHEELRRLYLDLKAMFEPVAVPTPEPTTAPQTQVWHGTWRGIAGTSCVED